MALKYKFKTKDEIPAELQSLYVERDGAWILDAEGIVEKSKHEEFRTNNIALTNQLKRFEGIDPDAVRQLAEENRSLRTAKALEILILERRTQLEQLLGTDSGALQGAVQVSPLGTCQINCGRRSP